MKINKIISTIIKLKEFPLKDLSSKISQTKNINISDILTSDNMTINQILKLANALDYELILKPKATNSLLYHIPVTLDDDNTQITTYKNNFADNIVLHKMIYKDKTLYCLDDICNYLKIDRLQVCKFCNTDKAMVINGKVLHWIEGQELVKVYKFVSPTDDNVFDPLINQECFETIEIYDKSQCLTNTNIIDAFIKERCSYDISSTINYYALYNEFCLWCKNFAYIHKDVTEKVFRDVINTKFVIFKQNITGICLKEGA